MAKTEDFNRGNDTTRVIAWVNRLNAAGDKEGSQEVMQVYNDQGYDAASKYYQSRKSPQPKPSEGTPSRLAETGTPEGKPAGDTAEKKPVYHGTTAEFEQFKDDLPEKGPDSAMGTYFTTDKNHAQVYAEWEGQKGSVIEADLNIKNPYKVSFVDYQKRIASGKESQWRDNAVKWRNELINLGHDGIEIAWNNDKEKMFVVFSPDNIAMRPKKARPAPSQTQDPDNILEKVKAYKGGNHSPSKIKMYQDMGLALHPVRLQDAEELGRMYEMLDVGDVSLNEYISFVEQLRSEGKIKSESPKTVKPAEPKSKKKPWQMTPNEYVGDRKNPDEVSIRRMGHPKQVKKALAEGKKVPREVLDQYKSNGWASAAIERLYPDPKAQKQPWEMTAQEARSAGLSYQEWDQSLRQAVTDEKPIPDEVFGPDDGHRQWVNNSNLHDRATKTLTPDSLWHLQSPILSETVQIVGVEPLSDRGVAVKVKHADDTESIQSAENFVSLEDHAESMTKSARPTTAKALTEDFYAKPNTKSAQVSTELVDENPTPEVTDQAAVQKLKLQIDEGQMILKSGTFNGKKRSREYLENVHKSVLAAKKKIGDTSKTPPVKVKKTEGTGRQQGAKKAAQTRKMREQALANQVGVLPATYRNTLKAIKQAWSELETVKTQLEALGRRVEKGKYLVDSSKMKDIKYRGDKKLENQFTTNKAEGGQAWDQYLAEIGREDLGLDGFLDELTEVIHNEASITAVENAAKQNDPYAQALLAKYRMLKNGEYKADINDAIAVIGADFEIDLSQYYIPEGKNGRKSATISKEIQEKLGASRGQGRIQEVDPETEAERAAIQSEADFDGDIDGDFLEGLEDDKPAMSGFGEGLMGQTTFDAGSTAGEQGTLFNKAETKTAKAIEEDLAKNDARGQETFSFAQRQITDQQYNSILKLATDTPSELRASDVGRVLDAADDQGVMDSFYRRLMAENLSDRTKKALKEDYDDRKSGGGFGNIKPKKPKGPKKPSGNRVISEDLFNEARNRLFDSSKLRANFDPQDIADGFVVGAYYFESGLRTFSAWSKKMVGSFGDRVKPHLQSIWKQVKAGAYTVEVKTKNEKKAEVKAQRQTAKKLETTEKKLDETKQAKREVQKKLTSTQKKLASAKKKLEDFMIATEIKEQHRQDAYEIVRAYVPKENQERFFNRVLNATTDKQKQKLVDDIMKFLEIADQRQARRDFHKFVKETKSKYQDGKADFGKLRDDVRDEILSVLDKYDLSKLSDEKRKELESRNKYIHDVAGTVSDAFASLEDSGKHILQMDGYLITEMDRLRKTSIGDLTANQIRTIHAALDHLVKVSERKGRIKENIRGERLGKLINTAIREEIAKSPTPNETTRMTGTLGVVKEVSTTQQASARTLVGYITGKDNQATVELITRNLIDSTKEKHKVGQKFLQSYHDMLVEAGITKKDTDMLEGQAKLTYGGKTFTTSIGNILSVYMDIRADGNLKEILATGREFVYRRRDANGLYIQKEVKVLTEKPSLKELRGVVEFVEQTHPKLKTLSEVYFQHNREVMAPMLNETSMAAENYQIARAQNYWHLARVGTQRASGKGTNTSSVAVEDRSRFQERTGGEQTLRVIPFQEEVIAAIQDNATYVATQIPMQDVKALVNNKEWQAKLKKHGHEKQLKALIGMINRIQGQRSDKDFIDMAAARLMNNFGKAALSLRLSGYAVQTASIPAAFEVIEPKYFADLKQLSESPIVTKKNLTEMMDLSPSLWMRWTARQFDFVVGGAAAQSSFDGLIWKKTHITDKMLAQYTKGDEKAIHHIFLAAQNKVEAETDLTRGTQEFKEAAMKITEEALETQPQWDMVHRNMLTSHGNPIMRGSLMFMAARSAQYNVVLRAVDDYKKGRISKEEAGTRVGGVVSANVMVAVVKRLIKMGISYGALGLMFMAGDDDEKEKIAAVAKKRIKQEPSRVAIDSTLNMMSLPAFGGMASNIAYEVINRVKNPQMGLKRMQDIRTGNIFADVTLDVTGLVSETTALSQYYITQDTYKSGPRKGELKWKSQVGEVADGIAELIAIKYGLPYSAPKGELYYQGKSAFNAVARENTADGIKRKIAELTYNNNGRDSYGRRYYRGSARRGQEDKVKELKREYKKRTGKDINDYALVHEWRKLKREKMLKSRQLKMQMRKAQ